MLNRLETIGVQGREILDSRGSPTVEAETQLEGGVVDRAAVPSGASTGKFEAVELWDGGRRHHGLGVRKTMEHVNTILAEAIMFENVLDQYHIDRLFREADGIENKENMGANMIPGVSMTVARAAANGLKVSLCRCLDGIGAHELPIPMMNVSNGGARADNTADSREFMIMPMGAESFSEELQMCAEIYHTLRKILKAGGYATAVDDEGGFVPNLKNTEEVLSYTMDAIRLSGYETGVQVRIIIDAASGELYNEESGMYVLPGGSQMSEIQMERTAEEMVDYYLRLIDGFPVISIEDGLQEEDWEGRRLVTRELGHQMQLVKDDLFVTNTKRLKKGIGLGAASLILVKMNQIGTLSESFDAIEMAKQAGYTMVISHHSRETEDSITADIAVAVDSEQIKAGASCRLDRMTKYNQPLRIEESLYAKQFV